MKKGGYVYIMTNKHKNVLYIGITNNLQKRISEHKEHHFKGSFTDKYNLEYCIYYEFFYDISTAISREKELKKWSRIKKEQLINTINPQWNDLWNKIEEFME